MKKDPRQELTALFRDRNLRFPARPSLCQDIVLFSMPDGLGVQFRGGDEPVIVRGRYATSAVDFILSTLDGSRSIEDLLEACPPAIPTKVMLQTVWLLFTKGFIVESESSPDSEPLTADPAMLRQLLFWGRNLDRTRSAQYSRQVQERLRVCRLLLVANGLFGLAAFDLLSRAGVKNIVVYAWDDDGLMQSTLQQTRQVPAFFSAPKTTSTSLLASFLSEWLISCDLIVTAVRNMPNDAFATINTASLQNRRPWLRGHISGNRLEIGPYFSPFQSACFTCMVLRERSAQAFPIEEQLYQDHTAKPRESGTAGPFGETIVDAALSGGLLISEAVRAITRIAPPSLINRVLSLSAFASNFESNELVRVPRCPDCYVGSIPPPATATVDDG